MAGSAGGAAPGSRVPSRGRRLQHGEDDDVAHVVADRWIECAAARDEPELRVRNRSVHRRGRELRLEESPYGGDFEDCHRAVWALDVDQLTWPHLPQPEEDARSADRVDMPGDDSRPDCAGPWATGVPAGHANTRWDL